MIPFYSKSIRKKLIFLFTITASLTVLVACLALLAYQFVYYRSSLLKEELAKAQLMADSIAPALLFSDSGSANETLSTLRGDPRIKGACLLDKRGVVVALLKASSESATACPAADAPNVVFTFRHLTIAKPIRVDNELVGRLCLNVGLGEMYRLLERLAAVGLCIIAASICFAASLSYLLERLISRPIIHLTEVATKVSKGGDYVLRAIRSSDDETGLLIDQFNIMMDRIQQRENELQNAHSTLESKIKERTIDLQNEIVERKAIECNLEAAKLAAEESNRAKSSFLANMSHELRTPLNAIIGYSEMIHEEAVDLGSVTISQDLDKVLVSARHLLALISDILDLSKIEAGQMQMHPELVSVTDVLSSVVATAEVLAKQKLNELIVEEPVWPGAITVDPLRFRQALLNLISNACKFTSNGTVSISVRQRLMDDRSWIVWGVRDTGVGIPAEKHSKLFQMFSQVDASTTRKFGGTGLGLAISQQFCNAMQGYIEVESAVGLGSTFSIFIPAA